MEFNESYPRVDQKVVIKEEDPERFLDQCFRSVVS